MNRARGAEANALLQRYRDDDKLVSRLTNTHDVEIFRVRSRIHATADLSDLRKNELHLATYSGGSFFVFLNGEWKKTKATKLLRELVEEASVV